MDTLMVAKFAQHRVNWMTVCQCYLGHTRASVYTSCEWPITQGKTKAATQCYNPTNSKNGEWKTNAT